jgi:hypothetical protein
MLSKDALKRQVCEAIEQRADAIIHDLLWEDARRAQAVLRDHTPLLGRTEYLAYQRGINRTERFDGAA